MIRNKLEVLAGSAIVVTSLLTIVLIATGAKEPTKSRIIIDNAYIAILNSLLVTNNVLSRRKK